MSYEADLLKEEAEKRAKENSTTITDTAVDVLETVVDIASGFGAGVVDTACSIGSAGLECAGGIIGALLD